MPPMMIADGVFSTKVRRCGVRRYTQSSLLEGRPPSRELISVVSTLVAVLWVRSPILVLDYSLGPPICFKRSMTVSADVKQCHRYRGRVHKRAGKR